jgi:hypothetical protein
MKIKVIVLMILITFGMPQISAQNNNLERLNAYKIAFFTKRLNLTSQEAEKFWPVYNEFQDMRHKLQLERQAINRNFNQNGLNMTEKEMTEAADELIRLQVREAAIAQEFHNKIKGILSPVKVLRLYQAENQYRVQLLNELQDRKQIRNNRNRP